MCIVVACMACSIHMHASVGVVGGEYRSVVYAAMLYFILLAALCLIYAAQCIVY